MGHRLWYVTSPLLFSHFIYQRLLLFKYIALALRYWNTKYLAFNATLRYYLMGCCIYWPKHHKGFPHSKLMTSRKQIINVREYRRSHQRWRILRNWHPRVHNTILRNWHHRVHKTILRNWHPRVHKTILRQDEEKHNKNTTQYVVGHHYTPLYTNKHKQRK
jgi:hypothetical protein